MFRKRHPQAGARPGTLIFGNESTQTRIQVIRYSPTEIKELRHATLDDIAPPTNSNEVVWIDIAGIDQPEVLDRVAKQFQLSPLAMEDIVNVPQRPKSELLNGQQLVLLHTIDVLDDGQLLIDQLSLILGPNYVVTIHRQAGQFLAPIRERLQRVDSRLRQGQSGYLAYAVIDTVVDGYYPILEWFGEELERLESEALQRPHPDLLKTIHRLRTQLIQIRRSSWPMREALESLATDESGLIGEGTTTYLRDTLDHCAQIVDVVEMYRESAGALISTYMSALAHRSNEVMKVLTMMSSVFVPLTFVAGIYGMNFRHMPELDYAWSYPAAWALMLTMAGTMIVFFYRRGWFGKASLQTSDEDMHAVVSHVAKADPNRTIVLEDCQELAELRSRLARNRDT